LAAIESVAQQSLPESRLSVRVDEEWREIWNAARAPERWAGPSLGMSAALDWRPVAPGVERTEVSVAGDGLAWRLRLILVRLDPAAVDVRLVEARRGGGTLGAWTVDVAPDDALLAINAGQFRGGQPWGWVVRDGREYQMPGAGG